jgi:hypothetical protein
VAPQFWRAESRTTRRCVEVNEFVVIVVDKDGNEVEEIGAYDNLIDAVAVQMIYDEQYEEDDPDGRHVEVTMASDRDRRLLVAAFYIPNMKAIEDRIAQLEEWGA